jgi:glucoamylase
MRGIVAVSLLAAAAFAPAARAATPAPAPGAPGAKHAWAEADKHGFGTSRSLGSHVWFTLRSAELTEVYYPDLSTPSFRSLEFAVTDGRTFTDRETDPGVRSRVHPGRGPLTFRQTTSTPRWRIVKTWVTDPRRNTVLARVRFRSLTGHPLRLYVLADPAPGDDGNDDRGLSRHGALVAYDDSAASAVAASPRLTHGTSGYAGSVSDPWRSLSTAHHLGQRYSATEPGNVVQAARTRLTGVGHATRMTLAVGFGAHATAARHAAAGSLRQVFRAVAHRYARGWQRYLDSLEAPPPSVAGHRHLEAEYEQSALVLAASEDKLHRGAFVASPTMPWVWGKLTLEGTETSGPYHLVWPRDLYHIATALQADGDHAAALRALDYLWQVQKPAGDWWQNTRVDGTPHWTSVQEDQVALPIVLAWWLGRTGATDWAHIRPAADFIVANGPKTEQERWENQSGWSPNTIATEVAGLICAAAVADANGDPARAAQYRSVADDWAAHVADWTATTDGPYSPDQYYLRITKDADPNNGDAYDVGDNHSQPVDERRVVDPSFLGLVLFGVKPADDPVIVNTLAVVDRVLRVLTPNGPVWHRFTYDGYGETRTGGDWNIFPTKHNQTLGRVWPILTGERGEYELLAGQAAEPYLRTIARTANDGLMLPEQVWDGRPPTGSGGAQFGEGTRSATPLAWTHAAFIRLAWSIAAGRPIELPSIVSCRYAGVGC